MMFCFNNTNTGLTLCCSAADNNSSIGDVRVLPAANHVGSSIIQKSGSLWVAITISLVNIKSLSIILNSRFVLFKCSVTFWSMFSFVFISSSS